MRLFAAAGTLAIVAAFWGAAAESLTLSQAATPAERPPSGYAKDIYVDSRGCVYVRATIGAAVNWVPRLSRDRKTVVCGMAPTGALAGAPPPTPPLPGPVKPVAAAPAMVASAPVRLVPAAPTAPTMPDMSPALAGDAAPLAAGPAAVSREVDVSCPADGSSVRVVIGGDAVRVRCPVGMTRATSYVVTHADGSRSRLIAHPARAIVAAGAGSVVPGGRSVTALVAPREPVPPVSARPVRVPAGYEPAWTDDRLNPHRGPRTALGDAQMAMVLDTTTVPMRPATPATGRSVVVASNDPTTQAPAPAAEAVAGARYVQVGAFRQSGNVANALTRIRGLGLGGATAKTGSGLTLVMAGPFTSAADLQRALATLRGFYPDAYPRG